jgi:hypothetical protein
MTVDYDDPDTEDQWCAARRIEVIKYLEHENVKHRNVGEWPAWHIAPYVSVWAIESDLRPTWVGWWVLCGDLPTDYVSADKIKHPREAILAIASQWLEAVKFMECGEKPPTFSIGSEEVAKVLSPLLQSRASTLIEWANNEAIWEGV